MSKLRQANGDDYADAAGKHLADAEVLLSALRIDGAAYHAGYVVECCLKALIQLETNSGVRSHDLLGLDHTAATLAAQAGPRTASIYAAISRITRNASVLRWNPQMRYQTPTMSHADGKNWFDDASEVYSKTVGALLLDGSI